MTYLFRHPGPDSIWGLVFAPMVWAAHFLWCYVVNAILCARGWSTMGVLGLTAIQANVLLATLALGPIVVWSLVLALRRVGSQNLVEHDSDTVEATLDAQRLFLARSALALSTLSLVGMVYVALPALFFATCR